MPFTIYDDDPVERYVSLAKSLTIDTVVYVTTQLEDTVQMMHCCEHVIQIR